MHGREGEGGREGGRVRRKEIERTQASNDADSFLL